MFSMINLTSLGGKIMDDVTLQLRPLFIRRTQLREIVGISASTAWRLEQEGKFPKRCKVAPSTVGWLYSEIEFYLNNCDQVG
jgi:prophage regulatory protein